MSLLLTNSGSWNVFLVKSVFYPVDWDTILNIPVRNPKRDDRWVCHFERWGSYNVKSGYHIARYAIGNPSSSTGGGRKVGGRLFLLR